MSIRVMTAVWDGSEADGGALLVLLAIADFANDRGMAFPSVARLARKARRSKRQVFAILKQLQAMGELRVESGGGRHEVNRYHVNVAVLATKAAERAAEEEAEADEGGSPVNATERPGTERVQFPHPSPAGGRVKDSTETVKFCTEKGEAHFTPNRHEPSEEPSRVSQPSLALVPEGATGHEIVPSKSVDMRTEFAEFYRVFPQHKGRDAAWTAYVRARKKVDAATIHQGAMRYAAFIDRRRASEQDFAPRFIAYPTTWLNQGRWADEIAEGEGEAPRKGSNTMEALRRMGENG